MAASFDPEFGSSSNHEERIWMYTGTEYHKLEISPLNIKSIFNVCCLWLKILIYNRLNYRVCPLIPDSTCYYSAVYRAIHDTCSWMAYYCMKLLCIPSKRILVHFTNNISCILNYGFYDCHFIFVNWFRYSNNFIIIFSVLILCILPIWRWPCVWPKHEGHRICQSIWIHLCAFCWYYYHYTGYVLSYLNDYYFLLLFLPIFFSVSLLIADYGTMDCPKNPGSYCTQKAHQIQWAPEDIENRRGNSTISKQYPKWTLSDRQCRSVCYILNENSIT